MAKSKVGRFRADRDTGVSIFMGGSRVLRLEPDVTYETDDPDELAALRGSSDVREMESTEKTGA